MWFSIKMNPPSDVPPDFNGVSKFKITLQCCGILGILSAIGCFAFIVKKLKINHVIRKILLFATVQQAFFYSTFLCSMISMAAGFQNKLTCYISITSMVSSNIGSQTSISMISIIRYIRELR